MSARRPARGRRRRPAAALGLALLGVVLAAGPASAHPLGNFSVNHHAGLVLRPDGVSVLAVLDTAEIPTSQQLPAIDADGDGIAQPAELAAAAGPRCEAFAADLALAVDGADVPLALVAPALATVPGAADLPTLRLTCELEAEVALGEGVAVSLRAEHQPEKLGWREVTAVGDGVGLRSSTVPTSSDSDVLRAYPEELLERPLDVRGADVVVGAVGAADATTGGPLVAEGGDVPGARAELVPGLVAAGDRLLQDTIGREDLTPLVGGLALLLAALLGAGHAALPGHGKTVMAAYLAGRSGTRTDALVVGATVTVTHTAGVLVLGLLVGLGSAVAGEVLLQRLGVVSGALVALIGVALLRDAVRARRARRAGSGDHDHGHDHDHAAPAPATVPAGAEAHTSGTVVADAHRVGPADGGGAHGHGHGAHGHGAHGHGGHHHGPGGHHHGPGDDPRFTRRGLIGMAVAGGLVPSPSALVVLLGSVALGRTLFGVTLVLAYGLGMAATLVAVGLLLVRLRDRFTGVRDGRVGRLAGRIGAWLPVGTAVLVLVVGCGLVLRSLAGGA